MRTNLLQTFTLGVAFGMVGCSGSDVLVPPGGDASVGGASTSGAGGTEAGGNTSASIGGISATGGAPANTAVGGAATGGNKATGGAATGGAAMGVGGAATGGNKATGGASTGGAAMGVGGAATGGNKATGGAATGGAAMGVGGAATGGNKATGGAATGGAAVGVGGAATGGNKATGGAATGGNKATGGAATGGAAAGGGTSTVNCSATMPTGGTVHTSNSQGGAGSLAWQYWANNPGNGSMTTFSTPAFAASWNGANDFLARLGLEWGSNPKAYTSYGTITAQYTFTKSGTAGGYSYIGIYGWSTNPCVEWYIVDNSFNAMPFTPYNSSQKGSAVMIDGENYKLYSNTTTGTGGNRCGNVTSWAQFWSVRQTARTCGTITINQHFDAWKAAGMALGNMLEAKILIETGGGNGSINFPIANVTSTQ